MNNNENEKRPEDNDTIPDVTPAEEDDTEVQVSATDRQMPHVMAPQLPAIANRLVTPANDYANRRQHAEGISVNFVSGALRDALKKG